MNQEIVIHAHPLKAILLLFGCIFFVILGIAFSNWLAVALFGLGIPASIAAMSTERHYLKITPSGLEIRTFFKKEFIRWRQVERFRICSIRGNKGVGFSFHKHYPYDKASRRISLVLAGVEGFIPNTYDKPAEELLEILCEWHERYTP